jgi:prepilin-type processing-associated H-X9-DG protein/prepilin-type N-terminal cleavage/methylation domain-containing protein
VSEAFTLIELLVVVAIIALLVAIALPAMGAARERGRQAVCSANLRTLTVGIQRYSSEYNDYLPSAEPPNREFPDTRHWFLNSAVVSEMGVSLQYDAAAAVIGPPIANTPMICPSHASPNVWREGTSLAYGLGYMINGVLGLGGRPDHLVHRRYAEFEFVSGTMLFCDGIGRAEAPGIVLYKTCPMENFDYRHGGKVQAAFLDGHVQSMTQSAIPFGMDRRYDAFWSAKRK